MADVTQCWVDVPKGSPFPLANLPFGVVTSAVRPDPAVVVRIGDQAFDLLAGSNLGLLDDVITDAASLFRGGSLDPLLASGPDTWAALRATLTRLLTSSDGQVPEWASEVVGDLAGAQTQLPFTVADYVDFYSSQQHAQNVGAIFRPDAPSLPENWTSLPIGYHGRAGTLVVSGTPIVRPCGQRRSRGEQTPTFGPSLRLDIECEVAFVVGVGSALGTEVPTTGFSEHVFGVMLLNDWSARDIQAWEYQPLGPFLGKSFATSVSPWVVPLAALAAARVAPPAQDPPVMDYLVDPDPWALDLDLQVRLNGTLVSRPPFRTQYWTPGQQLAHLTVNGASLRTGDVYASGTVTGPSKAERGSFLELSWGGQEPFALDDGSTRTFLEDGDTVSICGWATGTDGSRIGFGEVTGQVLPARSR
jgi:fumarylacetoacetase